MKTKWYNWTGDAAWNDYCRAAFIVYGSIFGFIAALGIWVVTL